MSARMTKLADGDRVHETIPAITLADADDAYHFVVGMPVVLDDRGRRVSRLRELVGNWWRRWTRWFRTRVVVSEIDAACGVLTVARERWSWRRWKWVRE